VEIRMRRTRAGIYGDGMSAEAARAAELLTQLSSPPRLIAFAELVRRGPQGATIAELAYLLDVPAAKAGEALARLVGVDLATGTGNGVYWAVPGALREAAAAIDRTQPIAALLGDYPQLRGHFAHGRLTELPPTMSERYHQLGELVARFLALRELCDEHTVNRRLATLTDEVAGLRRLLVETGWLERDRAGTTYGPGRPLPEPADLRL
jgi:hypothetical protein